MINWKLSCMQKWKPVYIYYYLLGKPNILFLNIKWLSPRALNVRSGLNPSICEKCADGYGQYNSSTGNSAIIGCEKCPDNCQRGSQGACSICDYGYGLVVDEPSRVGECDPCELHCSHCSFDSTRCSDCEQGYGIIYENDQSTNKCGPCKENCQKCSMDARKCDTCFLSYIWE